MIRAIQQGDPDTMFELLESFFAGIPYDIRDGIKNREQYYQSILYSIFRMLSFRVDAEVRTNRGRIDLVVRTGDRIYVMELKLDSSPEKALQQIKEKGYHQRYLGEGKEIYLVGIGFDTREGNIREYKVEKISR